MRCAYRKAVWQEGVGVPPISGHGYALANPPRSYRRRASLVFRSSQAPLS